MTAIPTRSLTFTPDEERRVEEALQMLQDAQTMANVAAAALSEVSYFSEDWFAVCAESDRIKATWHRVSSAAQSRWIPRSASPRGAA